MKKFLFSFLVASLFVTSSWSQINPQQISLENIYKEYRFYPNSISNIRSMNDGIHYSLLSQGKYIEKYSYESGEFEEMVLDLTTLNLKSPVNFSAYEFSADESKILLTTERENIYRHSYKAAYYIYDIKNNLMQPLSSNGKQQLACFSPDGSKIAFVRDNNLFVTTLETGEEQQISKDGELNNIINGAPDWVYEEEFGFSRAFAWSPDSKRIAYYRFDESRVKEFNMTMYEDLYPDWYRFKYPKAGEENSVVEIYVSNIQNDKIVKMDIGNNPDQYIPRIKWTADPSILSIVRLNRLQNYMEILHADAETGISEIVYSESEDQYISEVSDDHITYLKNGEEFVIISERDDYSHFYLYNFKNGNLNAVTSGNWDISGLIGIDQDNNTLYYTSHERSSLGQDVYSIQLNGKKKKRLSEKEGWNSASFSKNFQFFINTWSDINTPPYISLHNNKGKLIRVLEDNSDLKNTMKNFGFAQTEFFSFNTSDNLSLDGFMIKPDDFDENREYPLFMFVYGGPESQNVRDAFSYRAPWFQYLVQQGYIVACVDNRGTNGKGEKFRKATYMQLGKYETLDQMEAAQYLASLSYIDENRIGIFGWSYGGYMSLSCLFKGPEIFKMAISVAPVTNWRFYDTIYTERFMRKPSENPDGYDKNSPIHFVDGMQGKLLLVHGMGDDNVHFQNSTELVKALVEADKQFEMQFYPNKNHGIYGGNTTFHLYSRMTDFIMENL